MSIEAAAVKFTNNATTILVIARAWTLDGYYVGQSGHGAKTMEAAILMQLLHRNAPNTALNQYASFTNISPRLTASGRDLFLQMDKWFEAQGTHLAGSAYPENPGKWILANRALVPPLFLPGSSLAQHIAEPSQPINMMVLLYMALCKISPLCGLYEPLSESFTRQLLVTVGLPPLAESPAPAVYQPPRRRLY